MNLDDHPIRHLDDTVHQRARLGIMAILNEVKRADFNTIRATLELTPGNLSQHLRMLEENDLVSISKIFEDRRPRTWVTVTAAGRRAFATELKALQALIDRAERANPGAQ